MKNFLRQLGRALYQIIVVGIICLPYRLVLLVAALIHGLMCPGSFISMGDYYESMWADIKMAYSRRIRWVVKGDNRIIIDWDKVGVESEED